MSRKASEKTAVVKSGILYTNDDNTGLRVSSPEWFDWLSAGRTFYFQGRNDDGITIRSEKRRRGLSWYAFKRRSGKLKKTYVGRTPAVTLEKLEAVAEASIEQT